MLNHFRTVLLNEPYQGDPTEHIPKEFSGFVLSPLFKEIYNILFPTAASRYYKLFLAHNYLGAVLGAGLVNDLKLQDTRISYTNEYSDFFKINRHSNPAISNSVHPLFVYGRYLGIETNSNFYDDYLISQVDNTLKILIYSTQRELYLNGNQTFTYPENDAQILLDFSETDTSKPILIGSTGVSFSISNGALFTSTSNKTWEFLIEAPFSMDFEKLFDRLVASKADQLFNYRPDIDVTKYKNLWQKHYNPVYRIAGLLLAYVIKLSST